MCDEGIEIKCNFAQRERRMGDWSKAKRYHQRFGLEDIFSFSISVFSISSYHHSFIFLITPLSFTAPRPLSFACQNCDSCAFFKSSYISVCTMRPILMHVTRESLNWPVDQPITASSDLSFSHFTYEKFAAFFEFCAEVRQKCWGHFDEFSWFFVENLVWQEETYTIL